MSVGLGREVASYGQSKRVHRPHDAVRARPAITMDAWPASHVGEDTPAGLCGRRRAVCLQRRGRAHVGRHCSGSRLFDFRVRLVALVRACGSGAVPRVRRGGDDAARGWRPAAGGALRRSLRVRRRPGPGHVGRLACSGHAGCLQHRPQLPVRRPSSTCRFEVFDTVNGYNGEDPSEPGRTLNLNLRTGLYSTTVGSSHGTELPFRVVHGSTFTARLRAGRVWATPLSGGPEVRLPGKVGRRVAFRSPTAPCSPTPCGTTVGRACRCCGSTPRRLLKNE